MKSFIKSHFSLGHLGGSKHEINLLNPPKNAMEEKIFQISEGTS